MCVKVAYSFNHFGFALLQRGWPPTSKTNGKVCKETVNKIIKPGDVPGCPNRTTFDIH